MTREKKDRGRKREKIRGRMREQIDRHRESNNTTRDRIGTERKTDTDRQS